MSSREINTICTAIALMLFANSFALANAAWYQSSSVPDDQHLIRSARSMDKCQKNIVGMIGKLKLSDRVYQLYYNYKDKNGQVYWKDDMHLLQLDTDYWIIKCGDPLFGISSSFILQ